MSSKDDIITSVPMLDGSNWIIWETQMKAYLRSKGFWQMVAGNDSRPANLADGATQAQTEACTKLQLEWDNRDDQALGSITLRVAHSLRTHLENSSEGSWNNLSSAFSKQGPGAIYNDFQKVVNLRIAANRHPSADIDTMWDLFERLKANGVDIPKLLRVMLLFNVLPPSLQTVATVQLQTQDKDDLDFLSVRDDIVIMYEHISRGHSANKISAVKRKGGDPSFHQQKKRFHPSDQPDRAPQQGSSNKGKEKANDQKEKKHCKQGSGKNYIQYSSSSSNSTNINILISRPSLISRKFLNRDL